MLIPSDKKLISVSCYVSSGECLPILDFLREKLPEGVGLEDAVFTMSYHASDDYDPEGRNGHHSLNIGYLVSKKSYEEKKRKEEIDREYRHLRDLEAQIKEKKAKIIKMRMEKENG